MKLLLGLCLFSLLACQSKAIHPEYPAEWWKPVAKDEAKSWEILPQEAQPGEVILSKRNELGILSNFAPTPFVLHSERFASVEGFWQMMKYPEGPNDPRMKEKNWPYTRAEVAKMTAFEAKRAGDKAEEIMKRLKIDWVTYKGEKIAYRENAKGRFYEIIVEAEKAKLEQNPDVGRILKKTGTLQLRPDHHQSPNDPPAWRYFNIWMDLRATL